jgi:hypothetical protein
MTDRTRDEIVREREALRQRFGTAYDRLLALLFEEDPEGINFGHNSDEYDPEVGTILPRLGDCESTDDVQTVVWEEFRRWFGPAPAERRSAYRRIAKRIVNELPELLRTAG